MKKTNQVKEKENPFEEGVFKKNIKSLKADDRPREKLMEHGKRALSDAELLAIIIGSGNRQQTAVELSQQILASVNHQWNALAKLDVKDLCRFKGIGEAKAIGIVTALEIGKRHLSETPEEKVCLNAPAKAHQYFKPILSHLPHEEFWVVYLDNANQEIKKSLISKGGMTSTIVDVRLLMKEALSYNASGLFLIHNHPSGNLKPSNSDIKLTDKIKKAAEYFDIQLVDHLIFTDNNFFSFHSENMI